MTGEDQSNLAPAGIEDLENLGARAHAARRVKQTAPWVFSAGLHLGFFVLALLVAGTVRLIRQQAERPVIVADFDALHYEPVARLQNQQAQLDQEVVQDRVETLDPETVLDEQIAEVDPLTIVSNASSPSALARFAPEPARGSVSFVGLRTSNARRIVYVIDASGSLIGTLQVVVQELSRSLEALSPQQEFCLIFFQQNQALAVPPGRLLAATEREKVRALAWIDQKIIPHGSSNPLPALERALELEPDVIFLLSDNITGSGQYEIDQHDLLGLLDELNPRDPRTGRRPTQINCIQFLDPDPLHTLEMIAREHGGPGGYKFLDRQELGLGR